MFNIGVFMGWSELSREDLDWPVLVHLYIASILWTVTYETFYQHLVSPSTFRGSYLPPLMPLAFERTDLRISSLESAPWQFYSDDKLLHYVQYPLSAFCLCLHIVVC